VGRFVAVSDHAIDQFRERFPTDLDREALRFRIASEVSAAMQDGRYSTREPRWSGNGERRAGRMNGYSKERDRTIRFCWDAAEQHVYIVDRAGDRLVVVTSIRP
jgi:hypothetical protein